MEFLSIRTHFTAFLRSRISFILLFLLVIVIQPQVFGQKAETIQFARSFFLSHHPDIENPDAFQFDQLTHYGHVWIFETTQSPSFILVKEEDRPQLAGYSFENSFHQHGQVSEALQYALEKIEESDLSQYKGPSRLKSYPESVEPILASKWDQNKVTNYFCPEDTAGTGGRAYTGCVAVAMGQIVRHYNHWNTFFFESSYNAGKYGILTDNVGGYNWAKMEDRPICESLEVSRLLYHMGLVTRMGYSGGSSSTSNFNAYAAFKDLGYLSVGRMLKAFTDTSKWVSNFYRNISESKPLFVTGWGHAYVCDGYDSRGFFHFNLGWGGVGNGYYPLLGYGSFPSTEAFVDIIPWSRHYPLVNLQLNKEEEQPFISWNSHPEAVEPRVKFRIYSNEVMFTEITDSLFFTNELGPGTHRVQISAWYPGGESPWIGPITIHNPGPIVHIGDQALREAINNSIGIMPEQQSEYQPRVDELQFIELIEINGVVKSLAGIEQCQELKVLRILDNQGQSLDLSPLAEIQNLRILELGNLEPINLTSLQQNTWLIKLHLNNVEIIPLDQLTGLKDLISLKIAGVPVSKVNSLQYLPLLKTLQLKNVGLDVIESLESLTHVWNLDLSDNSIERISLNHTLPKLREFNLANNKLSQLWFIDKLIRIERLNLNANRVKDLIINQQMPFLKSLELAGNGLDSVWITRDLSALEYVDLNDNQIGNIDRLIHHAPKIETLKLGSNLIDQLWPAGLQQLKYLDISNNQLVLIDPITKNPTIRHFDMHGNQVGDFYPLIHNDLYKQLIYLDLHENPASVESFNVFFPTIESTIDTCYPSVQFESIVPCFPSPKRHAFVTEDQVKLSWSEGLESQGVVYDVFFGREGNMDLLAEGRDESELMVTVLPNESYTWQVRGHTVDTSFLSGLFDFQTYRPIELPYHEGFESFLAFDFLASQSPFWRTETNSPGSEDDAQVVNYKRLEGDKSLRMTGNSHLGLMVKEFNGEKLLVNFGLYIESNSHGAIKITNLNGADLLIYFKSNRKVDVVYNDNLVGHFFYTPKRWIDWQIYLSGPTKAMYIRMDGNIQINERLAFPQQHINFNSLEFSTEEGLYWPRDGFPLFYIDNLYVSGLGTTGIETYENSHESNLSIYPNPVDDVLHIKSVGEHLPELISLYTLEGRLLLQHVPKGFTGEEIELDVSSLKPGVYYVVCMLNNAPVTRKLLIN